jgi:hypothetical protein
MSRIEKGLHEHHARMAEQAQTDPEGARRAQSAFDAAPAALEAPFAKVNSVVAGSPAESAGLKVGDTITKFGWVDWTNHERLSRVAEAVSQNEGVSAHCWSQGARLASCISTTGNMLIAHSSPSPSRHCVPAHPVDQQKRCK